MQVSSGGFVTCRCPICQERFLYIQDVIQGGEVLGELTLKKIPTTHNPANVLTKHLPAATIQSHLEWLCLHTRTPTDSTIRGSQPISITIGMITTTPKNGEPWRFCGGCHRVQ
eukprot:1891532-Amphidinium_carterae.1